MLMRTMQERGGNGFGGTRLLALISAGKSRYDQSR